MVGWKKCIECVLPRGRPKKTWYKVVEKDCQTQQIYKEDAMGRMKWRKLIKRVVIATETRCEWVIFLSLSRLLLFIGHLWKEYEQTRHASLLAVILLPNFRVALLLLFFCRHGEHSFCVCRRERHDTAAESQGVQPCVMNSALPRDDRNHDDENVDDSDDLLARATAVSRSSWPSSLYRVVPICSLRSGQSCSC